jgi:glycosyltransferase involved in cell wall biosynthesis
MKNKKKKFISIIWGYPKYFYNFAVEENYHIHALKIAKDLGYDVVVIIKNQPGIIENDPLFDKSTRVIYYSNFINYIFQVIKYSLQDSIFYVNGVEPQSLVVPLFARKAVFMGHTHPKRQTFLKQIIFNLSMKMFWKIRLNNEEEKKFLLKYGLDENKLIVLPLSISLEKYKILGNNEHERKDLVYFGNITNKKNLPTIVKACNIVCEKYPDIKLNIIGKEYDKIDEKIISNKLKIIRYGFIEKTEDVNSLLNGFMIYLNSSFDEGMCVAVYNAALSGCALCLPKIMSFTGVFKDKALFHEITDYEQLAKNIVYYLENPQIAKENNRLCREMIIRNYNYQKISDGMKKLFTF